MDQGLCSQQLAFLLFHGTAFDLNRTSSTRPRRFGAKLSRKIFPVDTYLLVWLVLGILNMPILPSSDYTSYYRPKESITRWRSSAKGAIIDKSIDIDAGWVVASTTFFLSHFLIVSRSRSFILYPRFIRSSPFTSSLVQVSSSDFTDGSPSSKMWAISEWIEWLS